MRVEVDVDVWDVLDELDDDDLERELQKRKEKSRKRPESSSDAEKLVADIDCDDMDTALWHWRSGRTEDAVFYLERALGRRWNGLADALRRVAA
jgi:hypothetical protein